MPQTQTTTEQPTAKRESLLRYLYRRIRAGLALFGLLVLIYHCFFDVSNIISPSMSPTLQGTNTTDGDVILTERITYSLRNPRRWEIVKFINADGQHVMKRVVGLPGEKIALADDGTLRINNQILPLPPKLNFLRYYAFGPQLHAGRVASCGPGYFVFGDYSRDSDDSRFNGPLDPKAIEGRPLLVIWPWRRIGFVQP